MPDTKLVEQILSALDDGVPADVSAIMRIVCATETEVRTVLAAVAQYRQRVHEERDGDQELATGGDALAPGTVLGDFLIEGTLGRGAMGVVYRGRQVSLGRPVALKVLPRELVARDARFAARFRREATLAATIRHPHVAEVYGFVDVGETLGFAMRLVEGPTLHDVLQGLACKHVAPVRPTSTEYVRQSVLLVRALADALAVVHAQGLVHRDIKPANVLLERAETDPLTASPVLVDFGLLRPTGDSELTRTRTLLGTPAYASHESVLGQDVDARADVFSLGATLHDLLTVTSPGARAPATAGLPDARSINPTVDVRLSAIVAIAMQSDRTLRYEHGGAMRDELDRYLRGEPIRALPSSGWGRLRLWVRRDRLRAVRFGTALAGAILLMTATLWFVAWATSLTGLARSARKTERAGDLLGAAWAWQDLRASANAGWLPWLADDLERAQAYWEGDGVLRRALDRLREATRHRRDGWIALDAAGQAEPEARHHLAMANHHLCEVLFGPEEHQFGDVVRRFLLREVSDGVPEFRQRLAMDTWADYLLVQESPQVFPAELPPLLQGKVFRHLEPSVPTWQAAVAAYAAIRSPHVFADMVAILQRDIDPASVELCLSGTLHLYRWLHLGHRSLSKEPFATDRRQMENWAKGTDRQVEHDRNRAEPVIAHLAWWEQDPERGDSGQQPLALSDWMRERVGKKAAQLADEWRHGREAIEISTASASSDEHWMYLVASGRRVDPYTSSLWRVLESEDRDEPLAKQTDLDAAMRTRAPSRLDLNHPVTQRPAVSGTLLRATVRAVNPKESENDTDGGYLEFYRPGHSLLRLRTRVPGDARRLTIQVTHIISTRPVLRDQGRAVFRLSIPGDPPFETSSAVFNPVLQDPAGDALSQAERKNFLAYVPSEVIAGRDELEVVLEYAYGNTTYRVMGVELLWDVPPPK